MQPRSDTLFHFTKNINTLKNILKNGFWPKYCLEDFNWYNDDLGYIAYPMVCFCDIPLSRINEHVRFYGDYGIGLTKNWGLANKLSPVFYINQGCGPFDALLRIFYNNSDPSEYYENAQSDCNRLLSFIKPISGNMLVGGKPIEKQFYQENEWRYVPHSDINIEQWINKDNFYNQKHLDKLNGNTFDHGRIEYSPADIKYIFVKNDSDIPEMIDFIQSIAGQFTVNDMKILLSRIISHESINYDL